MATSKLHFLITNCPGPFRLVSGWVHMLERHGNRLLFEFTVRPVEAGAELLGHDRKFKIQFEVALMGATTGYGHGVNEPRNVRMLGRFLIPNILQQDGIYYGTGFLVTRLVSEKVAPELNEWQWEVVFNAGGGRTGFVTKLDSPLQKDWTM
ncbi:MAG: hypothetical protein HYW79_03695 [Parcubacteria group bacterium]|nr:hypothetical protein [Parcubacteria group bacterium]